MLRMVLWILLGAGLQPALYVDLSGDWRRSANNVTSFDLAAPQIDDSRWRVVRLPLAQRFSGPRSLWLRKTVDLPSGIDRTGMVLTLGVLRERAEDGMTSLCQYVRRMQRLRQDAFPDAIQAQREPLHWPFARDLSRVRENLPRPIGAIEFHRLSLGNYEPRQRHAIIGPLAHLGTQSLHPVRGGLQFDDKVWRNVPHGGFTGEALQAIAPNPGGVGRATGTVAKKKTSARVERFTPAILLGPREKLRSDGRISLPRAGMSGRHNDNVSLGGGLDAVVGKLCSQSKELLIGERHRSGLENGSGEGLELIYDQLHTHQLSLVAPPARRLVGRELGFDAAKAWGQNDDITVLTVRRNAS